MNRRELFKGLVFAPLLALLPKGLCRAAVVTKKTVRPHKIPCFYEHKGWRVRVQYIYRHNWKFIESYWVKGSVYHTFLFHDAEESLVDVMIKCEKEMDILFKRK